MYNSHKSVIQISLSVSGINSIVNLYTYSYEARLSNDQDHFDDYLIKLGAENREPKGLIKLSK